MKRNDLKEISEIQFLDLLRMLQNESFLDGWNRYDLDDVFPCDDCKFGKKESITDVIGWEKYQIDFRVDMHLNSIEIERIELFDLESNQINLSAEQRLKISTIIQERLTA